MNEELNKLLAEEVEARTKLQDVLADEKASDDAVKTAQTEVREKTAALSKALRETKTEKKKEKVPTDPPEIEVRASTYLTKYAQGQHLEGAEAELNKELGLDDVTQIPFEALDPGKDDTEERADVVTSTADLPLPQRLHAIMPRVFQDSAAAKLGIAMPSVSPGQQDYPIMTQSSGTTAAVVAEGGTHDAGKAEFTTVSVNGKRLTGSYLFNLEDVARLGSLVESTLRADLRQVLSSKLDEQILKGDGQGANFSGVETELPTTAPAGDAAQANYEAYRKMILNAVDGLYANTESAIRALLGLNTYKAARGEYFGMDTPRDAIDGMRNLGASVMTSAKVTNAVTAAKNNKKAHYEGAILTSEPSAAVAPIWQGVQVIRDPYTRAKQGEILLTFNMIANFIFKTKRAWSRVPVVWQSESTS